MIIFFLFLWFNLCFPLLPVPHRAYVLYSFPWPYVLYCFFLGSQVASLCVTWVQPIWWMSIAWCGPFIVSHLVVGRFSFSITILIVLGWLNSGCFFLPYLSDFISVLVVPCQSLIGSQYGLLNKIKSYERCALSSHSLKFWDCTRPTLHSHGSKAKSLSFVSSSSVLECQNLGQSQEHKLKNKSKKLIKI